MESREILCGGLLLTRKSLEQSWSHTRLSLSFSEEARAPSPRLVQSRKLAKSQAVSPAEVRRSSAKPKKAAWKVMKKVKNQLGKKAGWPQVAKKMAPKGKAAPSIQDAVVGLIREHGKPMPFQAILANIKHRRLVKTKAKDFENVLRRTL